MYNIQHTLTRILYTSQHPHPTTTSPSRPAAYYTLHYTPLHYTQPPMSDPCPMAIPSLALSLALSPHSPCPPRRARRRAEGTRTGGHGTEADTEGYGQRHLCNCRCTRVAGESEARVAVNTRWTECWVGSALGNAENICIWDRYRNHRF